MRRRYIYRGTEAIEVTPGYVRESTGPVIIGDIQPYRSMIDGNMITSRSQHREHLRAHGCVEVGNDSSLHRTPEPLKSPPGLKEVIARIAYSKLRY